MQGDAGGAPGAAGRALRDSGVPLHVSGLAIERTRGALDRVG